MGVGSAPGLTKTGTGFNLLSVDLAAWPGTLPRSQITRKCFQRDDAVLLGHTFRR